MDGASGEGDGLGGHLDEGTIHAWLDGALSAERAAGIASHVASCPECAAAVAEARGLIAGASRVVRALDDDTVSSATGPAWGGPGAASAGNGGLSLWRMLRVTPARAAIAATLLVALGVTLTYPRSGLQETARLENQVSTMSAPTAAPPAGARDPLLDSAIKRNIAAAQPLRTVEPAPGAAIPPAPGPGENAMTVDATASSKVAAGRVAVKRARESAPPEPDQARTRPIVAMPVAKSLPVSKDVMAPLADRATADAAAAKVDASAAASYVAAECYRVESATPGAAWGPVALPFVVALQPTANAVERGGALIIDPGTSRRSDASALWSRRSGDTIQLDLTRAGFSGQLMLAAGGEERKGTMLSAQSRTEPSAGGMAEAVARTTRRSRAPTAQIPAAKEPAALAAPVGLDVAQPVAARRIRCPDAP